MKYVVWAAMAIVTLMILMGSVTKLMGNPAATTRFATRGFPALFATFIGVCEIAGAFGIWFRRTDVVGKNPLIPARWDEETTKKAASGSRPM